MVAFLTLDDVDVRKKVVGVRIDVNSAIVNGKIEKSERLVAHAETLKELARKKAKVVVLAHQGRRGGSDYRELYEHVALLAEELKMNVRYVHDVCGKKAVAEIQRLEAGEILVLRNVRSRTEEAVEKTPQQHAQSKLVRRLQPLFKYYVQDAFSNAHRGHASMVGFYKIPYVAGRVMERELHALAQVQHPKRPFVFLIGGIKTEDVLDLVEKVQGVDVFLAAGSLGELCGLASGYKLGKKEAMLQKGGELQLLQRVKKVLQKKKIVFPRDFAVKKKGKRLNVTVDDPEVRALPVMDIGDRTIADFAKYLRRARTVYVKGPVGAYEEKAFQKGTRSLFRVIARSRAFSLAGGGNTLSAMEMFIGKEDFSHRSLGGGALLAFLLRKKMPCLELLERWKKRK